MHNFIIQQLYPLVLLNLESITLHANSSDLIIVFLNLKGTVSLGVVIGRINYHTSVQHYAVLNKKI